MDLKFTTLPKPDRGDEQPESASSEELSRFQQSMEETKRKQRIKESYQPKWGSQEKREAEGERIRRRQGGIPEPETWDW